MAPLVASQHSTALPLLEATPDYLAFLNQRVWGKITSATPPLLHWWLHKFRTLEHMSSILAWMSESQGVTG
jgi:hypothetical protein